MWLRIASRKSDLARIQAHAVAASLKKAHPEIQIEFHFSESLGDKNLTDPLWKMPEKGVFTQDLTRDLLEKRADLVVHSWKDLPVQNHPETEIVATLPREDVRDLLLFKKSARKKLDGEYHLQIFSSSPRREYNLTPFLLECLPGACSKVEFKPVRGNIQTRVRKLMETPEIDGLVLAKAALDRLLSAEAEEFQETRVFLRKALQQCDWMVLPLTANPAAAAQGALAIEIRSDREDVRKLLSAIHDERTFREVIRERQVLKSYGGGCHQKIGVTILDRPEGSLSFLRGLTDGGQKLSQRVFTGPNGRAEGLPSPKILRSDWLFSRVARGAVTVPKDVTALYLSHASSWRESLKFEGIRWTAGLATWKKLAEQGLWINGCSEGLGEAEDARLQELAPGLKWGLLAHGKSQSAGDATMIATYDLVPVADAELPAEMDLHWTSSTLFDEAVRRWPEIADRRHSCGPGKTWEHLRKRVKDLKIVWPVDQEKS